MMCFFYTRSVIHARMIPLGREPEPLGRAVRSTPAELFAYACVVHAKRLSQPRKLGRFPQAAREDSEQRERTAYEARFDVQRVSECSHKARCGHVFPIAYE